MARTHTTSVPRMLVAVRLTLDNALHFVERAESTPQGRQVVDSALPRRLVSLFPVA